MTTRADSSKAIAMIRTCLDSILADPPLRPLVPEPSPLDDRAVVAFYEWAAFDSAAIEARAAKRLIEGMR